MNNDTDRHCNDLTQLCSREQLSALMDGALPEDQTRFLLRRLQHDAALAGCWERWRMAADTMRGVAPSRRLPTDFASRVATALQEDAPLDAAARASARTAQRRRLGGGAALAAALAAMAILGLPSNEGVSTQPASALAESGQRTVVKPALPSGHPVPQAPIPSGALPPTVAPEAVATLVAAAARPTRRRTASPDKAESGLTGMAPDRVPASTVAMSEQQEQETATRPWPRSVLPQFGNDGLTVGFGELPQRAEGSTPFLTQTAFSDPPRLLKAPEPAGSDKAQNPDGPASADKQRVNDRPSP